MPNLRRAEFADVVCITDFGREGRGNWKGTARILEVSVTHFERRAHHGFWWCGGARSARLGGKLGAGRREGSVEEMRTTGNMLTAVVR